MAISDGLRPPDDHEQHTCTTPSKMPPSSELSRPIVPLKNLMIYNYRLKKIKIVDETGEHIDSPKIERLLVYPVESKNWVLFTKGEEDIGLPLPLQDLKEIKIVEKDRHLISKQSRVLELSFIGNKYLGGESKALIATIKVEDMFINDIIERLRTLKQLQYDSRYWGHHKLTITKENYPAKTIEIYPNAPFLADGEEMIWQHTVSEVLKNGSKTIAIDAVTNYRVFQYRYDMHYGTGIVFPLLGENTVIVEQPIPETTPIGSYFIYSLSLTGIKDPETNKIAGDITFYGLDKSSITFTQITDPETLSTAVRRLRETYTIKAIEQPKSVEDEGIVRCSQCENNNPPDSKYCNKCGSSLSTIRNNF